MYLGVDIGGTKTCVATIDENTNITEKLRFATPQNYDEFLAELAKTVAALTTKTFTAAGVGVPGRLDREQGIVIGLGNLPWQNKPIRDDIQKLVNCPVVIENDANLAALSEAMLHKDAETVLYLTISTGIGSGVVYRQQLEPMMLDSEGGHIMFPYEGKVQDWEAFASGKAIYERFGMAADINDPATWQDIIERWALGFHAHMALVQPDLIIIGGSIGTHFAKYGELLKVELQKYNEVLVPTPPIVQAQRPEEAVLFGCYDLIKPLYGSPDKPA